MCAFVSGQKMSSRFPVKKFCHALHRHSIAERPFIFLTHWNATALSCLCSSVDNLSTYPSNHDTTTLYNYLCKFDVCKNSQKRARREFACVCDCHDWQTNIMQSWIAISLFRFSHSEPQLRRGPPGIPNCCRLCCKSVSWKRNHTQPNQQISDSCRGDGQYRLNQRGRVVGKSKGLVSKVRIQTNQSNRANHCKLEGFKGRVLIESDMHFCCRVVEKKKKVCSCE